jgi:hypothetical protein
MPRCSEELGIDTRLHDDALLVDASLLQYWLREDWAGWYVQVYDQNSSSLEQWRAITPLLSKQNSSELGPVL